MFNLHNKKYIKVYIVKLSLDSSELDRIIIIDQLINSIEKLHIFSNYKTSMGSIKFFIVGYISQLVMKPSIIVNIGDKILFPHEQSNRHIFYITYINIWGAVSIIFFLIFSFSVVKVSEFATVHDLPKMKNRMKTCSVWIMAI